MAIGIEVANGSTPAADNPEADLRAEAKDTAQEEESAAKARADAAELKKAEEKKRKREQNSFYALLQKIYEEDDFFIDELEDWFDGYDFFKPDENHSPLFKTGEKKIIVSMDAEQFGFVHPIHMGKAEIMCPGQKDLTISTAMAMVTLARTNKDMRLNGVDVHGTDEQKFMLGYILEKKCVPRLEVKNVDVESLLAKYPHIVADIDKNWTGFETKMKTHKTAAPEAGISTAEAPETQPAPAPAPEAAAAPEPAEPSPAPQPASDSAPAPAPAPAAPSAFSELPAERQQQLVDYWQKTDPAQHAGKSGEEIAATAWSNLSEAAKSQLLFTLGRFQRLEWNSFNTPIQNAIAAGLIADGHIRKQGLIGKTASIAYNFSTDPNSGAEKFWRKNPDKRKALFDKYVSGIMPDNTPSAPAPAEPKTAAVNIPDADITPPPAPAHESADVTLRPILHPDIRKKLREDVEKSIPKGEFAPFLPETDLRKIWHALPEERRAALMKYLKTENGYIFEEDDRFLWQNLPAEAQQDFNQSYIEKKKLIADIIGPRTIEDAEEEWLRADTGQKLEFLSAYEQKVKTRKEQEAFMEAQRAAERQALEVARRDGVLNPILRNDLQQDPAYAAMSGEELKAAWLALLADPEKAPEVLAKYNLPEEHYAYMMTAPDSVDWNSLDEALKADFCEFPRRFSTKIRAPNLVGPLGEYVWMQIPPAEQKNIMAAHPATATTQILHPVIRTLMRGDETKPEFRDMDYDALAAAWKNMPAEDQDKYLQNPALKGLPPVRATLPVRQENQWQKLDPAFRETFMNFMRAKTGESNIDSDAAEYNWIGMDTVTQNRFIAGMTDDLKWEDIRNTEFGREMVARIRSNEMLAKKYDTDEKFAQFWNGIPPEKRQQWEDDYFGERGQQIDKTPPAAKEEEKAAPAAAPEPVAAASTASAALDARDDLQKWLAANVNADGTIPKDALGAFMKAARAKGKGDLYMNAWNAMIEDQDILLRDREQRKSRDRMSPAWLAANRPAPSASAPVPATPAPAATPPAAAPLAPRNATAWQLRAALAKPIPPQS